LPPINRSLGVWNPPPTPRSINPAIPRDMEAIVFKAIERDPATRFRSASELGEDLRRFFEDRPFRARRVTAAEQVVRWCRRRPAVASLIEMDMLAVLASAGVASFFAVRADRERGKAVTRELEANAASKQATRCRPSHTQRPDGPPRRIPHPRPVEAAVFCDDGMRLVVDGGGIVRAWDAALSPAGPEVAAACDPPKHQKLMHTGLSLDGVRMIARNDPKTFSVWDLTSGHRVFGPAGHPDPGPVVQPHDARIGQGTS
jgi:hypothetical protein